MQLSFDDKESFRKTSESLLDRAPTSDPNTLQQMENNSMPLQVKNDDPF
jgi:hypothetical protein